MLLQSSPNPKFSLAGSEVSVSCEFFAPQAD